MKRRDEQFAWSEEDGGDKPHLKEDANKKKEQAEAQLGFPQKRTRWLSVWLGLLIGSVLIIAYFFYTEIRPAGLEKALGIVLDSPSNALAPPPDPAAPTKAPTTTSPTASALVPPPHKALPTDPQAGVNDPVVAVEEQQQPLAPPPRAKIQPAQANEAIIGVQLTRGKLLVQVENYWAEENPPGALVEAGLSALIGNNGAAGLQLYQVEVTLLDNDSVEYKPCKAKLPIAGMLDPQAKVRGLWAFQLPANVPIWCAQFKAKDAKSTTVIQVGLTKHTPENEQLVASEDYAPRLLEFKTFASPRFVLRQQIDESIAKLEPLVAKYEAGKKSLAKLDKTVQSANKAADSAAETLAKKKDDVKEGKEYIQQLKQSFNGLIHDDRVTQGKIDHAERDQQRAESDADAAAKTLKDKEAQRAKLQTELKDGQKQLDALKNQFEQQKKAIEDLQKKLAQ
ncbi:MAG: hypothetical protein ABSE73_29100 [Planctomycetota bacterium]